MHFSSMNKLKHYICILIIFFVGCAEPSNFERIDDLLKSEFRFKQLTDYDQIIVINEMGECMKCNNTFAEGMSRYLDRDNLLFVICSAGNRVDISPFIEEEKANVILDYGNEFESLGLIHHCAIFELDDKKVDAIVEVSTDNVHEVLLGFKG